MIISFSCSHIKQKSGLNKETKVAYLKNVFKEFFLVDVAINGKQYLKNDVIQNELVKIEFNSISPNNDLRWRIVQSKKNAFFFDNAKAYVKYGLKII